MAVAIAIEVAELVAIGFTAAVTLANLIQNNLEVKKQVSNLGDDVKAMIELFDDLRECSIPNNAPV